MDVDTELRLALKCYQAGNLRQTVNICQKIVKIHPDNINAINLLAIVSYQQKDYDSAIEYSKKLIGLTSNNAEAHYILGHSMQEKGRLDEAIIYYQKALQLNPNLTHVYYNLGTIFQDKKSYDEAISCYQKALQFNPTDIDAIYNTALSLEGKGRLKEAIDSYKRVLELNPDCDEAHGRIGLVLQEMGQSDEASGFYRKANQLNPNNLIALYGLGVALQEKGQFNESIKYYYRTLEVNPDNYIAYNNLGNVLRDAGRDGEAIDCFKKALEINANHAGTYDNLGNALRHVRRYREAVACFQKALQIDPNHVATYVNLGGALADLGRLIEAEKAFRRALQIQPDSTLAYSNLLFIMNYSSRYDANTIFLEHCRFAERFAGPLSSKILPHFNDTSSLRRLKVGYVSPDFRNHSVHYFVEPILAWHNREHFEVFCYSNSKEYDEVTRRIQGYADQWRNIKGMPNEQAAELIRKDQIDILVDLAGHTADNRILLFACKPAPVQVTWIGYPCTTGLSMIDYKIVDNYSGPPGMAEQFYAEKLMRLPESFLCYLPETDSPDIGNLPALSSRHITFGSFNNFTKVSQEIIALWAKILGAIAGSRLIMKAHGLSDAATCDHAMDMFAQESIVPERIKLLPWEPTISEHLGKYGSIDIALDTFPYNGTTTTCEALWMGVPVITLSGGTPASHVGVSILSNVGLPELVAGTPDEYVSIAVNLAGDLNRLQSLRQNLRDMMRCSPLCDAKRFISNLETCYSRMWETWYKSL
jgi:protein O-GlcNAc transferase